MSDFHDRGMPLKTGMDAERAGFRVYEHQTIVRQEHLNQYGNLFGGYVLLWIDELAFIGRNFVTRALHRAEFHATAHLGDMLEFAFAVDHVGRTSVHVHVHMSVVNRNDPDELHLSFDGTVVLVCVDDDGQPIPVRRV